jgi:arylsulfatase A-like enzyme
MPSDHPSNLSRRGFLKKTAVGAGALAASSAFPQVLIESNPAKSQPNILFIIVDQWRFPQHLSGMESAILDSRLPNYRWLFDRSVKFSGHYGAAAACTPVRSTIVTGLYTHQTGIMNTFADNGQKDQANTLNPGFLTWGTALRELGYQTAWWGKWHESPATAQDLLQAGLAANLEQYGFDGGSFPPYIGPNGQDLTIIGGPDNGQPDLLAPIGFLNQGIELDGFIADQFRTWYEAYDPSKGPFATAVSLINPHDIKWYPVNTLQNLLTARDNFIREIPVNYEDLTTLQQNKPSLQQSLYYTNQLSGTPDEAWRSYLDFYYWLHTQADIQIGSVLSALHKRKDVAENTIVVFTADHGDHGGSHGLHEKSMTVYEESIHLPLLVHDPKNRWTSSVQIARPQLTSTVDLFALFLTIACGGNSWRSDARFSYLTERVDWDALLTKPAAKGRDYIISTSDEFFGDEFDPAGTAAPPDAPFHVIGVRTCSAKFATYNYWTLGTTNINASQPQELELYDYSNEKGRLELDNTASSQSKLAAYFQQLIQNQIIPNELQQTLPEPYNAVQTAAIQAYINGIQIPNSSGRG